MSSTKPAVSTAAAKESLISALGAFAASFNLELAPSAVRQQAKLSILDTIGCCLAGAGTPEARQVLAAERSMGEGSAGRVFGFDAGVSLDSAMRLNGYTGDIFELNDLIGGHASIAVVTLVTTLGDALGSSGSDVLKAAIVGIETICRVYSGYYSHLKPYTQTGITPPGIPSTLGCAAAAASLLKLSPEQCSAAIANAGAMAGWCPAEVVFGDGGTIKPMLFGAWPANVGYLGARYAAQGVTGPGRLLESEIGFFATVATTQDHKAVLRNDVWHLNQPRRKLHACCGYIHSAIDVLIDLRKRVGADELQKRTFEIKFPDYIIPAVSKSGLPTSPNEARFHAEYCIALAAAGADVILPEHSIEFGRQLQRPEILALMKNIRIAPAADLKHYHHCRVTASSPSSVAILAEGRAPKGSPQNPMTDDEVVSKFRRLAEPRLGAEKTQSYIDRTLRLEEHAEVSWLF